METERWILEKKEAAFPAGNKAQVRGNGNLHAAARLCAVVNDVLYPDDFSVVTF